MDRQGQNKQNRYCFLHFATHKNTETGKKTSKFVTTLVSKPANDAIISGLHYIRLKDLKPSDNVNFDFGAQNVPFNEQSKLGIWL